VDERGEAHAAALARAAELFGAGRLAEAEAAYRAVLAAAPHHAAPWANLGAVLHSAGRYEDAIAALTESLRLEPAQPVTHRHLAVCVGDWGLHLQRQGRGDDALAVYRKALAFDPTRAATHNNLGTLLLARGDVAAAHACFDAALALEPDNAEFHFNRGNAARAAGALDGAIASYRVALDRAPDHADAQLNLGSALLDQGALAEALGHYRAAVAAAPDNAGAASNLLMASTYDPAQSAGDLAAAARALGARLSARGGGAPTPARDRDRDPARRLRLGYVSADFRFHPVGWFIQAPLLARDRAGFEVTCYANGDDDDALTGVLRGAADHWRAIKAVSDDDFAAQVAADRIDILIDLAGHSAHNRLPALARRLAPIQAHWIGFPATTGIGAIDYLIADAVLAPPGSEADFSETVLRLPAVAWCYRAPGFAPAVAPLPARAAGGVTFGSFNNPVKLNPAVLETWAAILARVPAARLLLKFRHLDGGAAAARLRAAAAAAGIPPERLMLEGASPHPAALAAYARVDIALDPFPFNGGTTTCEALWMGVPVVTMAGATMAGRMGASFVAAAGCPALVAPDRAGYVDRAVAAAGDLDRLAALRGDLRRRMAASPLCDAPRFMTGFEAALRGVWRRWCISASI
jgi:predicted O-linked N-acetylglucosamine transferase (SPINDLY family)